MSTKTVLRLARDVPDNDELEESHIEYQEALDDTGFGAETRRLEAAQRFIAALAHYAGITMKTIEECDECDEEATEFWPNLVNPVQLCASCEHNARRSGWEPGQ